LSVKLVTVSVPVPAADEITLTMHVPAALAVHGLGVRSVPAPVHVNAIIAPAAGTVVVPSVRVAWIVKSCWVPTGLLADGVIVTLYATQVFVAVIGGGVAWSGPPAVRSTVKV
jgi:hypothetical protein